REKAGLSQGQLKAKSGVSQNIISRIERGKIGKSRPKTLKKLADALGTTPESLLSGRSLLGAPVQPREKSIEDRDISTPPSPTEVPGQKLQSPATPGIAVARKTIPGPKRGIRKSRGLVVRNIAEQVQAQSQEFIIGDVVQHQAFGIGKVARIEDGVMVVYFDAIGEKKFQRYKAKEFLKILDGDVYKIREVIYKHRGNISKIDFSAELGFSKATFYRLLAKCPEFKNFLEESRGKNTLASKHPSAETTVVQILAERHAEIALLPEPVVAAADEIVEPEQPAVELPVWLIEDIKAIKKAMPKAAKLSPASVELFARCGVNTEVLKSRLIKKMDLDESFAFGVFIAKIKNATRHPVFTSGSEEMKDEVSGLFRAVFKTIKDGKSDWKQFSEVIRKEMPLESRSEDSLLRALSSLREKMGSSSPTQTDSRGQAFSSSPVFYTQSTGLAKWHTPEEARSIFEAGAVTYGGKGAWSKIIEELAEEIGFNVPSSVCLSIQEGWAKYIQANRGLVERGNNLILNDIKKQGQPSIETKKELMNLIEEKQFLLPPELADLIKSRASSLKGGQIIARSSGRWEDSYIRNLAGVFISPRKENKRLAAEAVEKIFKQAIKVIWRIGEKGSEKIEGLPDILSAEEGIAVVIQNFLNFTASGTAMSNLYGHTSIEAVIGDAKTAVMPRGVNIGQYVFKKDQSGRFEYDPIFLELPYEFILEGKTYLADKDLEEMRKIAATYPKIDGKLSPLSPDMAKEVNRAVNALEARVGVPLDVEWGFSSQGKLYIVQIRPIIGDCSRVLSEISSELEMKPVLARTPIALGHTRREGFTAKMVLLGNSVSKKDIAKFESEFRNEYIRVQSEVASGVLYSKTTAKVLVDPTLGSRQAHNVNFISDRINLG
ncbi:MAG: PEP/pyruvate-binding domain-containing protein, partial [Candidatus Omnitrophica bacterium]|nr:PEP/pyruvate-binding domain-containing protein [Candidatus Omnitrophota bacterium]